MRAIPFKISEIRSDCIYLIFSEKSIAGCLYIYVLPIGQKLFQVQICIWHGIFQKTSIQFFNNS